MPTYLAPGIYVEERSSGTKPIAAASTSVAAFIGVAVKGVVGEAVLVSSFAEFVKRFGGPIRIVEGVLEIYLYYAVRHFFAQGGSRCYVVRVATTAAARATAAIGSLTVSAISPGVWGRALSVEVEPTSQFSLPLVQNAAANDTRLMVADNTDVRVGSLLWIVDEATGIADAVNVATGAVTFPFGIINLNNGTATAFQVLTGSRAYTPDLLLDTTVTAPVNVVPGTAPTLILASVLKADGSPLQRGDTINFALRETVRVATRVGEAVVGGQAAMEVGIAGIAATDNFASDRSRVYERGFTLTVREQVNGVSEVVETHRGLSLVQADPVNHVEVRLPAEEGRSFYVMATGAANTLVSHAQQNLANGDDGLPNPAAGANLDTIFIGGPLLNPSLTALDKVTDASILCVTHATTDVAAAAIAYCDRRKDMVLLVDPPRSATSIANVVSYVTGLTASTYAAVYFPWIQIADPVTGRKINVPPSGAIAGIFARSDAKRGVHKAPAGTDVGLITVATGITRVLTKAENDTLHGAKVNAIRSLPEGIVVWGARTISADPEWVYVNVRRLFIFLEQSIRAGTQWVTFEPNDQSLWKKLRRNISAFLRIQWLEGKLVGATEDEAFYVKCDAETNPPEIVDAGMVVTEIGVAPSKPAEFVVFRIRQIAGGDATT